MKSFWSRKPVWIGLFLVASALAGLAMMPHESGLSGAPPPEIRLQAMHDGLVKELVPSVGQIIDQGAELIRLDDTDQQKTLELAQADLQQVAQGAKTSDVAISLPGVPPSMQGTIVTTGNRPVTSGPGRMPKNLIPLPPVNGDGMSEAAPVADPKATKRLKDEAAKTMADAKSEVASLTKQVEDTKMELEEAERAKETSRIITERARQASEKAKMLLSQGAISANESGRLDLQARQQEAIKVHNDELVAEAKTKIDSLNGDIEKAKQRQAKAETDFANAPAAATPKASTIKVPELKKQIPTATAPRTRFFPKPATVVMRPSEASTAPVKVEVDKTAIMEGDQLIREAMIKVNIAEKALLERRLIAPRRMRLVKWLVNPGDNIKTGQAIAVIEYLPALPKPKIVPPPAKPIESSPIPEIPSDSSKVQPKPLAKTPGNRRQ